MSEDSKNHSPAGSEPDSPEGDSGGSGDSGAKDPRQRQLVLVKRGQRFVFRYQAGEEAGFLEGLMEMVEDPDSSLDWFDAAVLSHQMGQTLGQDLQNRHKR